MARGNTIPKPPDQRRRRNADAVPWRELATDGAWRGPELPAGVLRDGEDWHPMTRQWWDAWRRSPMAQEWLETDWLYLLDTARIHHGMWSSGRWELAGEVRLRLQKFGATPEDRMRLRRTVETPVEDTSDRPPATVASIRRDARAALRITAD